MERDDIESFTPAAGTKVPSRIFTGYSKGPTLDSILKAMDYEDILKEVSKHPACERKALLRQLKRQSHIR